MEIFQAFGNSQQHIEPGWPVEVRSGWCLAVQEVPQVTMGHVGEDSHTLVCLTAAPQEWEHVGVVQARHDAHLHIELQVPLNPCQRLGPPCIGVDEGQRVWLPSLRTCQGSLMNSSHDVFHAGCRHYRTVSRQ